MLRVALVGIGDAGKHHARALLAAEARGLLRWSAVVGRDPAKLAAFLGDASSEVVRVADTRSLFERDLCDAVVLATPHRPVDPYLAQLEAFALAAPHGFVDDPSLLANVRVMLGR